MHFSGLCGLWKYFPIQLHWDCSNFPWTFTCIDFYLGSLICNIEALYSIETLPESCDCTMPPKKHKKGGQEGEEEENHNVNNDLLNETISNFLAYVRDDVSEMKKSMNNLVTENMELRKQVEHLEKRHQFSENLIALLQKKLSAQHEEILDLQCRSMRDNLVFRGIPESNDGKETWDKTKEKLIEVLKDKSKMPAQEVEELQIDRAYRMGSKGWMDGWVLRPVFSH